MPGEQKMPPGKQGVQGKRDMQGMLGKQDMQSKQGMLYFCATPIGNLGDITLRALQCLKEADLIAVESVERSRKLLHYYGIKAPLLSYREANRERKGKEILARLKAGASIVLITDAGMPSISDPGFSLARLLLAEKVPFTVLPGPSAVLTALVYSGYSTKRFVFWGFLSRKKKERAAELRVLADEQKTIVLYVAPHHLLKTLHELMAILGDREIAVCRELTKKFEEVQRGSAGEMYAYYSHTVPRGEITLVISPLNNEGKKQAGTGEINEEIGRISGDGKKIEVIEGNNSAGAGKKEAAGKNGVAGEGWATGEIELPHQRVDLKNKLKELLQAGDLPTAAVKKVARQMGLPRKAVYALWVDLKQRGDF